MALQPHTTQISVSGGNVTVYVYGDPGGETLLCLNGGPGVASQSMRAAFQPLYDQGMRVVFHDQLGTGASDNPDDPSLWTIERYVAEVDAVRAALRCDRLHILGHSWGGWLAIEYAVHFPERLISAIFSCTGASTPFHITEIRRLLSAFGEETLEMVDRIERAGDLSSPLYKAICTLFYGRHSSRRRYMANEILESSPVNMQIQESLWGPAEFSCDGQLANWDRTADLRRLEAPALVLVGAHDYLTPASAKRISDALPNSSFHIFKNSGHFPFLDEPQEYFDLVARHVKSRQLRK